MQNANVYEFWPRSGRIKILLLVVPPWNILCWFLWIMFSPFVWLLTRATAHLRPPTPLREVVKSFLLAPIGLGTVLYTVCSRAEKKRMVDFEQRVKQAGLWLVAQLAAKGIQVTRTEFARGELCYAVVSAISPEQREAYQEAYREALQAFPDLPSACLCRHAFPIEPLDEDWARSVGIDEYGKRYGNSDRLWGSAKQHAKKVTV